MRMTGSPRGSNAVAAASPSSISQTQIAEAYPEPATPSGGAPRWPKISTQLSAALTGTQSSSTTITTRARDSVANRQRNTAKPRNPGTPQTIARR